MAISNRLDRMFAARRNLLSVYFTAGHPRLDSCPALCRSLEQAGVDSIEIGFPFSDPLADGPVIQHSADTAIRNGMTLPGLFEQLKDIRLNVSIPLVLMGYLNPVLQFGPEKFFRACRDVGIDGLILPDLPLEQYKKEFKDLAEDNNLHFIFLITPNTSDERIRLIDRCSTSFIYAVSSAAVTGGSLTIDRERENYFKRLADLRLDHPLMIGFGISDRESFTKACEYAHGAIIGSALIRAIDRADDAESCAAAFVRTIMTAL